MSQDSPPTPAAPFVAAVFNAEGLGAARLGQPISLTLRVANVGNHSYYALLPADDARQARLTLDLAAAGLATAGELPAAPLGFGWEATTSPPTLTLRQTARYWPWLAGDVLEVPLPTLTATGEPGLRQLPLTLSYLVGDDTTTLTVPLLLLPATAPPAAFTVRPAPGADGPDELLLRLDWATPAAEAPDATAASAAAPVFYVLLSAGLAPGQRPLAAPAEAATIELDVTDDPGWQAERVVPGPYPAWCIKPAAGLDAGTTGELYVRLHHLPGQPRPGEAAHLLAFGLGLPGGAAGGQVVSLRPGGGPTRAGGTTDSVVIEHFTASPEQFATTTAPTLIQLSWKVRNAQYVTLSGEGLVGSEEINHSVFVEGTTTFVLTAYGSRLSQVVAEAQQVRLTAASPLPPPGTIVLWNGKKEDKIPDGWALCDGRNNTPDLRDRFVLGAGTTAPHAKGPADRHTHRVNPATYSFPSEEAGRHTHQLANAVSADDYFHYAPPPPVEGAPPRQLVVSEGRLQESGAHYHQVTLSLMEQESEPNAQEYRPAWYALCYLMKL